MLKEEIQIGDISFISLKEASQHTTYTRDYLSKLAREEKIEAKHVGRQWFVNLNSLNEFIKKTTHEQEERKLRLREERKRERLVKQKLLTLNKERELKIKELPFYSLCSSLSVLVFGIFIGTIFYTHFNFSIILKSDFKNNASVFLAQNEENFSEMKSNITLESMVDIKQNTEFSEYPLFIDRSEVRFLSKSDSGILLLPQIDRSKDGVYIDELFSDPVEIKIVEGSEGVVTYVKQNGEKVDVSFISIPNNFTEEEIGKNSSP